MFNSKKCKNKIVFSMNSNIYDKFTVSAFYKSFFTIWFREPDTEKVRKSAYFCFKKWGLNLCPNIIFDSSFSTNEFSKV